MKRLSWVGVAMGLLAVAACGGSPSEEPAQEATDVAVTQVAEPQAMTPTDLGNKIAALYVAALTELADAMAGSPAAADLRPTVEALKESYVTQLVELGRQRAAFSDSDKATVNSRVSMGIDRVPSDVFSAFSEGQRHYQQNGDMELAKMIGDFNIITQYADFELLKQQEPAEAERLGIE